MRTALLAAIAVLGTAPIAPAARADSRGAVAPMMRADDEPICNLLRASGKDRCKRVAAQDAAAVYLAGAVRGIRRAVIVIAAGEHTLVSPSLDLAAERCGDADCKQLSAATPTLRSIAIDGRPGIVLDLLATFGRGKTAEHTHALVGCGQTAAGMWKCATVDVGACEPTVSADGAVTSCGATTMLSLR